jgi:threonine dehydrogenase-like Zn-dependent dehydrogenase
MSHPDLPDEMNALVWEAPSQMALRRQPLPALRPGEVLVQVAYAGICGSELSGYLGHNALRIPPLVMGHEFSGKIAAIGRQAREEYPELAVGARVTANPLLSCGNCAYCKRGLNQLCRERKLIGAHRPGAFAKFVAVPASQLIRLPESLSDVTGALAEPAACGVRIAELAGEIKGETILVIGAGTIGLMALQALRNRGAGRIFIADLSPDRLAAASHYGGEPINSKFMDVVRTAQQATGMYGAAVVVDAVGLEATRAQAIQAVRSTGVVILSGLHEESSPISAADIIRREIALKGCFAYSPANFAQAVHELAEKTISLDEMVLEAGLGEGGEWFDRLVAGKVSQVKVLLKP